eukprot:1194386-Prorocentrum_minimum.AAC.4
MSATVHCMLIQGISHRQIADTHERGKYHSVMLQPSVGVNHQMYLRDEVCYLLSLDTILAIPAQQCHFAALKVVSSRKRITHA